ncbi:MAG: tetratricopeptide repeat protein, partial [Verrucomicrobiota bacterium]
DLFEARLRQVIPEPLEPKQFEAITASHGRVHDARSFTKNLNKLLAAREFRKAMVEIDRAASSSEDADQFKQSLGEMYLGQGDFESGEAFFISVLEKNPADPAALKGMVSIACRAGEFERAMDYVNRIPEVKEEELYTMKAYIEHLRDRSDRALELLDHALVVRPGFEKAQFLAAIIASERKDWEKMDRIVSIIRKTHITGERTLGFLAEMAWRRKRWAQARVDYEEILADHDAYHVQALTRLLRLDLHQNRMDDAAEKALRLIEVKPKNPLANYILARVMLIRDQMVEAEAFFRTCIETTEFAAGLNDLAWLLYLKGNFDEALPYAEKAVTLSPDNGMCWDSYGEILRQVGRLDDAEVALKKAVERMPDHPEPILHLAQIYEERNAFREAMELVKPLLTRRSVRESRFFEPLNALHTRLVEKAQP